MSARRSSVWHMLDEVEALGVRFVFVKQILLES